ncbi:MAG: hypothetical protein KatS3mg039_0118 [Candidatus Kapaibacterium sp.]|nr:MAG: hypothetical protein KatS3mg039_0118 [Candidatus Kapabacteria bacterium]
MRLVLVSVLVWVGCSSSIYLQVDADDNANFGAPVPVDIVFADSPELEQQLIALSAQEWFAKREQVLRDNPDEDVLKVVSFEFVPGQKIAEQTVRGNGVKMAIVFVNMGGSAATNRARVPVGSTVHLRLGDTTYQLDIKK